MEQQDTQELFQALVEIVPNESCLEQKDSSDDTNQEQKHGIVIGLELFLTDEFDYNETLDQEKEFMYFKFSSNQDSIVSNDLLNQEKIEHSNRCHSTDPSSCLNSQQNCF